MSTDLYAIISNSLDDSKLRELPVLLGEYSCANAGSLRLRFRHGYSGELQEQGDGWSWQMEADEVDSKWTLEQGVLVSEERWSWDWKPEHDKDFEQWFQQSISYGYLRMTSTLSTSLSVGLRSAVVSPPIRWRNLFDPVVQADFRRYTNFLTGFFGGNSAIYVPDDIDPGCEASSKIDEGWSLDQITDWLYSQMAPATAISTAEMIETTHFRGMKGFQARGYYYDRFDDLDVK